MKDISNIKRGVFSLALLVVLSLLSNCAHHPSGAARGIAQDTSANADAYDIYNVLRRSQFTHEATPVKVRNSVGDDVNKGVISYGGEKEGSSSRITKISGPDAKTFRSSVVQLNNTNREQFLREFLREVSNQGNMTAEKLDGTRVGLDPSFIPAHELGNKNLSELTQFFDDWVEKTQDNPFSFLKRSVRRGLYNGEFPGFDAIDALKQFPGWVPLFGGPEKFVDKIVPQNTVKGWEVITKPQYSYGEHEQMIKWFKTTMGSNSNEFQSFGHQRIVWPKLDLAGDALKEFQQKLAGTYRLAQAYIVMRGIGGKTGINQGHWKFMMSDADLKSLQLSRNDIFRLEQDKFVNNSMGLEMRAGTKDAPVQRFIQQVLTSRIATQDFGDIEGIDKWTLISNDMIQGGFPSSYDFDRYLPSTSGVSKKFEVSEEVVERAFENIKSIKRSSSFNFGSSSQLDIPIRFEFWVPFWNWDDAPFLSDHKKKLLKTLTRDFLETVAGLDNPTQENVQRLFQDWVRVSELDEDLMNALRPKKKNLSADALKFEVPRGVSVDVNRIDLGIEYSASYPLDNKLIFSDEMPDGKKHWLLTTFDLSDTQREDVLKEYAENLAKELGVNNPKAKKIASDGHGHGLDIAYSITDPQNRKWRVEWDGIGRSYSPDTQKVLEHSKRGGHIEIVTPKFTPEADEVDAVYRAMDKTNMVPAFQKGGSHINLDLAAFEGKPKQFARFIALFHEHRSIISLMYQHPNRRAAAEALDVDPELARALADFQGSEDELKQLLYDKRYFNTRLGRKTRYTHLDVSAYFQDVIPEEFIHDDFDIGNPWEPWRKQFRVDPKIRKAELRLFGAPESAYEAALQIKLVRALMHKALNEDAPLSAQVQNISHEDYIKNPKKAYADLEKMMNDLGLDKGQYEMHVSRGLEHTEQYTQSIYYRSLDNHLAPHPKTSGWKKALATPRSKSQAISSSGRAWPGVDLSPEVERFKQNRIQSAHRAFEQRDNLSPDLLRREGKIFRFKDLPRSASCREMVQQLMLP